MTELSEEKVYDLYWQKYKGKERIELVAKDLTMNPADLIIYMRKNDIPITQKDKAKYPIFCDRRSKHFINADRDIIQAKLDRLEQKLINAIMKEKELKSQLTPEEAQEKLTKLTQLIEEYSKKLDKEEKI